MQNQNGGFPLIRHDDYLIIDGALMSYDTAVNYLAHYGTPKMRWGQRWYQYEDGSLTPLGRIHYGYGKSKKDYALAAAWATKEGLKVGAKSVGKAAVSGAKAIANAKRKSDEGDFERRKRKAAETAEGVAKNPEYFTNDELKSLNERFNTESQIRDKGAKEHKEKKAYREMIAEEKAREKTQKRLEKDARKKAKEEEKKAKAAKADEKHKKEILAKGPDELLKPENRRLFTNEELEAARVRFDKEAAIRKQVNDKRYEDQQASITRAKTYIDAADKAFKMAQSGVEFAKKMDEAVYLIKGHHLFNPNDTADRRSKDDKNKDQKNDQQNQPKNNNNQPKNNGGGQQGGNNQPKNNPPGGGMQTAPWTPSSNQNGQQNVWNTVSGEDISRASKDVLKGVKKPKYESNTNDGLDLTNVQYSVLQGAELLQALDEIYGKKIKHSDYLIINGSLMSYDMAVSYLEHSGTKGMRWGVRRWQNYDGSLTEAGYKHYGYGKGDSPRTKKQYQKQLNDYDKMKALNKRKIRDVQPDIDYYDGVTAKMQKLMAEGRETKERGEAAIESYKTARARYQKVIDEHKKNIEEIDKKIDLLIKGDINRPETGLEVTSKATTRNVNNGKEIAGIVGASITFGIPGFAVAYPAFNREEWGTKYKVKTSEAQKIKESLEDPFERAMYEGYKARANKESDKKTHNQGDVQDLIKMGYSSTEIARMTGVSESSVRSQRKRAAKHSDIPEYIIVDGYIMHYGVKGQKKGIRQWQNKDGSLTPAGREHYGYGTQKKSAPSMYDIYSGGGGGLDDDEEEDDEQETEEMAKPKSSNPVLDFVVSNMTRGLYDTNDVKETVNTYRNKYQSVTGKTDSKSEKKPKNEPKVFGSIHIGANQETINLAKERGRQLADAFNKRKDEYFSHLHLVSRTTKRKSK